MEIKMQKIIFCTVGGDEIQCGIQAAWIARTLNTSGELPRFGTSVLFEKGSAIAREVGIQIPRLCEQIETGKLSITGDNPSLLVHQEIPRIFEEINADTLIVSVSMDFFVATRVYFESYPVWMEDEPVGGAIVMYSLVARKIRYGSPSQKGLRSWQNF